ncbi:MAG: sialidase family protein [Streptosporangiaceae bacterium]
MPPPRPGFEFDRAAGRHRRTPRPPDAGLASGPVSGPAIRPRVSRVALLVAVLALGVAAGLVVNANSQPSRLSVSFPPAVLAGRDFAPYLAGSTRGIVLSEGRVASAGDEVVAVGAESGQLVPRAQFFVSPDGGRTWSLGGVRAVGGGTPPPGHAARFVAGGAGAWVAIGSDAVWTSTDGQQWTLTSATGLPERPGDYITVLKRMSNGFIAAGANLPNGKRSTPVIFLSADGRRWTRLGASQLGLGADPGRVQDIRLVAATGNLILAAGDVAGPSSRTDSSRTGAAWLSSDGGRQWRPVTVPAGHGARAEFSDLAATADGFLLVRPATVDGRPAADVYRSGNGTDWTFAATLTTSSGFSPGLMNGSADGAVLAGGAGSALTAFTSADGIGWRQVPAFGRAPAEAVSGVAVTPAGAVIADGSPSGGQQLITIGGSAAVTKVSLSAIPGGVQPQVAVDAVAAVGAQGRQQVAVGSANGFPAAWASGDGGRTWRRAAGQTSGVLTRPGIQQLTGVAHGPAGWLAVGGASGSASGSAGSGTGRPVVIVSADGRTWSAADGEPVFAGSGLTAVQAAAGRTGYVIVGSQVTAPGRTVAAAWWSAGLTGWHRAADATTGALDGLDGSRRMLAVTATAGGFMAVGSHGPLPAAWTTPDGRAWSLTDLPLPAGATAAALQHVAAAGRTVVATGVARIAGGQLPFSARSADGGRTWTETELPVPAGTAEVSAVAATAGGFTVTGTFGASAGERDVVVWTSWDGTTWKAATPAGPGLATPGVQAITGLAATGHGLTGVGFTATPAGEQPTLWQPPIGT